MIFLLNAAAAFMNEERAKSNITREVNLNTKFLSLAVGAMLAFSAVTAHANGITVAPFTFSAVGLGEFAPAGGPKAHARWERVNGDWQLYLAKNVATSEIAAAGAQINGVKGLSTTGMTLGFTIEDGHCGAGGPRFNVRLTSGDLIFLGCSHGIINGTQRSFTAGNIYGTVEFPEEQVIDSISIIFDEGIDQGQGFVHLDDIFVNSSTVGSPSDNRK